MSHTSPKFLSILETVERDKMKYKLTETAKVKYQVAFAITAWVGLFAIFMFQGLGVM